MREIRQSLPDLANNPVQLNSRILHNYWAVSHDLNGVVFQLKRSFRRHIIHALNRWHCPDRRGKQKTRQVPYLAFQNRYEDGNGTVVISQISSILWDVCLVVWSILEKWNSAWCPSIVLLAGFIEQKCVLRQGLLREDILDLKVKLCRQFIY